MTALDHYEPDDESLLRDFESQLHGGDIFGSEIPLDVRKFLKERELSLHGTDETLQRLLEIQLCCDIRGRRIKPGQILINDLLLQFADLPSAVVFDLAVLEYRLRAEEGAIPAVANFADEVQGLDDVRRRQLADEVQRVFYLAPTVRQQSVETETKFQFTAGDLIANYRVIRGIGRGGMGEVYEAQQLHPISRTVALKVIQRGGLNSAEYRLRFEAERQAQALMDHPHIAKVFEAGVTDKGLAFVALEYVCGTSIVKYCDNHSLTINARLSLFLQTCRAIQHAHQKGIIHRDITPGNVLVSESTSGPTAQVIDFGLAKAVQSEIQLTAEEMYSVADLPIGTFFFMSPEQTRNARGMDVRTDVYSLGAVLYLLLTGTPPIADPGFRKKSDVEKCRIICEEEPTRPSQRVADNAMDVIEIAMRRQSIPRNLERALKGELDWIVLKALEKDRERRYSSVAEFAEDIERYLTQRPVLARPSSLTYRLRKSVRRNKAATAILVTVLAATLGMSYQQIARWKADADTRAAIELRRQAEIVSLRKEYEAETAKAAQRASERGALLQRLLITPVGTTQEDNRLLALENAMSSNLVTNTDRIDLQLTRIAVLHRLQSFDRLNLALREIRPITDRQRGQIALWNIRKAYRADEQRKLAQELLKKIDNYELEVPDVGYLKSLLAPTRLEAIRILYEVIDDSPQHEFSRKLLITLLLLQGQSGELDAQIEKSRLLFPGSVDVELAEGLALAFRGDRPRVEFHLERLKSMTLLSDEDREFQEKFLVLLSRISEAVLTFNVDSQSNHIPDVMEAALELKQQLTNPSELPRLVQEALGPGSGIGLPDSSSGPVDSLLSTVPARLLAANVALSLKQPGLMNHLISDIEHMSPVPGDAFFARLRAYVFLAAMDYRGAAKELDLAIESPSVFPRLKSRMLYEAAMCHAGIAFETTPADQTELRHSGELALRWAAETDELDPVATQRMQNALNLNGQFDAVLQLIHRCREANPQLVASEFVSDELKTLTNARRFPEVIRLAEHWLASDSGAPQDLKMFCRKMHDEAVCHMLEIVNHSTVKETVP